MLLRSLLARIYDLLTISGHGLTEDERLFVADWEQRYVEQIGRRLSAIGCVLLPITAVISYVLSPQPHHNTQTATHAVLSGLMLFYNRYHRTLKLDARKVFLLMELSFAIGYALTLRLSFSHNPDIHDVAFLSTLYVAIMIFNIVLCPYFNATVLLSAAVHVLMAIGAWSSNPQLKLFDWSAVATGCAAFALALSYSRAYQVRDAALRELATRKLLVDTERLRFETVERDMAVASEIQDSFAPKESVVSSLGMEVSFYQIKHDLLGGDWSAARALPSGDLAVVVADATGKGIQAALVIHSIQTLWAKTLTNPSFDPDEWLSSANSTLVALGRRKEHTMSLGLMILNADTLTYYSAGHVPLFLMCQDLQQISVASIVARGNLLGMMEDLVLVPQRVDLRGLTIDSVLMGTDGVFDRGIRTRKEAVTALLAALKAQGADALQDCPAIDDKLAVWIRRSPKLALAG